MGGSSEEKGRPIPCNCYKIDCYEIFNQTIVGPVSFFFLLKKSHVDQFFYENIRKPKLCMFFIDKPEGHTCIW